jgi:hypothetical protein
MKNFFEKVRLGIVEPKPGTRRNTVLLKEEITNLIDENELAANEDAELYK